MVAPSFSTFEIVSETFYKGGKAYVKVQNPKTKTIREVRQYTREEFAKAYPAQAKLLQAAYAASDENKERLRYVRGFSKGNILAVVAPKDEELLHYLRKSPARCFFGEIWYFPSDKPLPEDIPAALHLVPLDYYDIVKSTNEIEFRSVADIKKIIKEKINER